MKQFNLGDLAVYPNHGVGKVVSIEEKNLGPNTVSCYVITTLSSASKLFVPVDNAKRMGLRKITPATEATDVYRYFETKNPDLLRMNWNKRYRFLQDKMKVGTAYDVAMVISDLLYLKKLKGLSYGEEKLLTDAEDILTTELSISEEITKSDVKEKIYSIIA
jgi:CarD family transcriptional regulator